ncbi:MAG: hypothetical protein QM723_22855 [Myxococcaceae bacterium]
MNRPRRNLLLYLGFMLLFGWLGVALPYWAGWIMTGALVVVLSLVALVGRELFKARVLMKQRQYVAAAQALQKFQTELKASGPRRLIGALISGRWTFDAVAVAENDLGAIASEAGHSDVARKHFEAAAQLDPGYAIPHVNLALLAASRAEANAAFTAAAKARELGFRSKGLQRAIDVALQAKLPPTA